MNKKLWGGRFKKKMDPAFEIFSSSFKWDKGFFYQDLSIDKAHVKALKKCGILSSGEAKKLFSVIASLQKKYLLQFWTTKRGPRLKQDSEDIHSAIHRELNTRVGLLADKLHTARSRNDLVSQSARLYCRQETRNIMYLTRLLQKTILSKAEAYQDTLVPGMTHMQNAQIVSQAHIFLAYVEMLERAVANFEAVLSFCDVCVLGSGALAGVTFKLDQRLIANELSLSKISNNSYDVAGDRDFALHFLYSILFLGLHLSRIAEDLMIGQTKGFSLVDVDQAYCTGSSMMPQKKNADFLELVRGVAGVFMGNLTGLATTLKGLPTSYNRDLQWDKKYLTESQHICNVLLGIFIGMFETLKINKDRAKELLSDESLYATDLADYLVNKRVPFKKAHEAVGKIVSYAEENQVPISKIGLDVLKRFALRIEADVYDLFDPQHSVRMKKTIGSTNPAQIRKQIQFWKKKLRKIKIT